MTGAEQYGLEVSPVYLANVLSPKTVRINEGGTGSTKTWSILMVIIYDICLKRTGTKGSIVRSVFKNLKDTAFDDFQKILKLGGLWEDSAWHKSDSIYTLNGNRIQFMGIDRAGEGKRGARRDWLYLNEAQDITIEQWVQLKVRTKGEIFIDYNPSFLEHKWIDKQIALPETELILSNYLDGWDFLNDQEKSNIEWLASVDPYYETVYKLGKRARPEGLIYTYKTIESYPEELREDYLGLDLGYANSPTALLRVGRIGDTLYLDEILYETGLSERELDERLKAAGVSKSEEIIADAAAAVTIAGLRDRGYNVRPGKKGEIKQGIGRVKSFKLAVTKGSSNIIKELNNYKWRQTRDGEVLNEPVKAFDHSLDALRYVVMTKIKSRTIKQGISF